MQGFSPITSPSHSSSQSSNSYVPFATSKPRPLASLTHNIDMTHLQQAHQSAARSSNMHTLMQTLDCKVHQNTVFQANKNDMFQQECHNIHKQLQNQRYQVQQWNNIGNQVVNQGIVQCQTNCHEINLAYQLDRINLINSSQTALKQLKQSSVSALQYNLPLNIKQNSIFLTKTLQSLKKSHTQSLITISSDVTDQLNNLQQLLTQNRLQRQQKQSKLRYMIQSLMTELQQTVQKQTALGTIVYDSLLTTLDGLYQKIGRNASINYSTSLINNNTNTNTNMNTNANMKIKELQADYHKNNNSRIFGINLTNNMNSNISKSKSMANVHSTSSKFSSFDYNKY